jgi:hypothetical protein
MPKKRLLLPAGAAVAAAIITLITLWGRSMNLPPAPVGIAFVGNGEFDNSGALRSGPTFLVTNRTAKALCVTPWAIEVRQGTNWTKRAHRAPPVFIAPHAAAYETIDFASQQYPQPAGTWRLTLNVAEKMAGAHALLLKIKQYPAWLRQRGNTNLFSIPNSFKQDVSWYGNPKKVLSGDVASIKGL